MQLLSDTRAFGEAFFETHVQLLGQSMQVEPVRHDYYARHKHSQYREEPPCLPERRLNLEVNHAFRAVPFAEAVAGTKAKMVGTRAQIGVNRLASSARLAPPRIEALKKISKTNPLRHRQA